MKYVVVDKGEMEAGCWISDSKYPRMDKKYIHQTYATGKGEIVRHLCSNSYCINPMHLIRGSAGENNADEMLKNHFILIVARRATGPSKWVEKGVPDCIGSALMDYALWKSKTYNEYCDVRTAKQYLEIEWRKTFKAMMIDGVYHRLLGERIIKEQITNAAILMARIKLKRGITIVEV